MITREFKDQLNNWFKRAYEKTAKKKYFQAVGRTLYYNEETGEWRDRYGNLPIKRY